MVDAVPYHVRIAAKTHFFHEARLVRTDRLVADGQLGSHFVYRLATD